MSTQPLPLSIIANLSVITSSPQVAAPTFNTGLVIGPSAAIPSYGTNPRIRKYLQTTFSTAMITDGFTTASPEYICMQIMFSQSPAPQAGYVGRQDLTAIQVASATTGNAGTGYIVGDVISVTQGGASHGQLLVSAVTSGAVTALQVIIGSQGTGYAIANGLATSGGSGTGLEVNITAIGETALQATQACRAANSTWYPVMVTDAAAADNIAIAAWAQSQVGTIYFGNSAETNVLNGIVNNTFKTIYAAGCSRTWMQYATTQGGLVPNQIYFTAAVMGNFLAANSQLANSSFTEKFSAGVPLVGVVTEPLSLTQIANIEGAVSGLGPNGNTYLNYANSFNILEQGTMMAPQVYLDQIVGLDVLASNIQFAVLNLMTSQPKIPQTDAGQQLLIQAVESACQKSLSVGFIGAGVWQGQTVLKLVPGTALPLGFLVQSPSYSTLSLAQITTRIAPPIYVAIIESGAVHFVTIQVLVQV
jgi:hypothetical protein